MDDDNEWHLCLQEAVHYQMPRTLRTLFATILCHATPSNPVGLWLTFANDLSHDFWFQFRPNDAVPQDAAAPQDDIAAPQDNIAPPQDNIAPPQDNIAPPQDNIAPPQDNIAPPQDNIAPPQDNIAPPQDNIAPPQDNVAPPPLIDPYRERAKRRALGEINNLLVQMGSCLADFPDLPQQFDNANDDDDYNIQDIQDMLDNEVLAARAQANFETMNNDQKNAFNLIVAALQGPVEQRLFFIDGPGGTGKSFVYNTLIAHTKGVLDKKVIVVASSGIAALVLHGGQTAHSTFKIPIPIQAHSTCNIRLGGWDRKSLP